MDKLAVYKKNGKLQRRDNTLTREIVNALCQRIKSGENIFGKGKVIILKLKDEQGQEYPFELRTGTLINWVTRESVVPDTGEALRDILNRARREYRLVKREEKRDRIGEKSEKHMEEVLDLNTLEPRTTMFGKPLLNDAGEPVMKHNTEILKIKTDIAKYASERLIPDVYGKVDKNEHKVVIFDLAELRRAHDEMERQGYFDRK